MKLAIIGSGSCPPINIAALLKYIPDTIISCSAKGDDTHSGHYVRACGWSKVDIVKNMLPDNIDWTDEELKEINERHK